MLGQSFVLHGEDDLMWASWTLANVTLNLSRRCRGNGALRIADGNVVDARIGKPCLRDGESCRFCF
jgi:hypothetical protein